MGKPRHLALFSFFLVTADVSLCEPGISSSLNILIMTAGKRPITQPTNIEINLYVANILAIQRLSMARQNQSVTEVSFSPELE